MRLSFNYRSSANLLPISVAMATIAMVTHLQAASVATRVADDVAALPTARRSRTRKDDRGVS